MHHIARHIRLTLTRFQIKLNNTKFGNTYNPNWQNHPNLSWGQNQLQNNFRGHNAYRPPFQGLQGNFFEQSQAQPSLEDPQQTLMQHTNQTISKL